MQSCHGHDPQSSFFANRFNAVRVEGVTGVTLHVHIQVGANPPNICDAIVHFSIRGCHPVGRDVSDLAIAMACPGTGSS